MKQTDLVPVERQQMSVAQSPSVPIADMLRGVVEKGVTVENASALEKLVGLYERMQEKEAEKQFAASFVALQQDLPTIVASSVIPNRGKYERFEDVMKVVQPLLTKHGFALTFSNDQKDNRVTETCHLMHVGGHMRSNSFTVRISGKADSETQADCKAGTTAKRNALLNCLNIVIRQDCLQDEDDPRNEGDFITPAQAEELQRRVRETESNEIAFLKLAGVGAVIGAPNLGHYKSIMSGKYAMLDEQLQRKEQRGR